MLSHHGPEWGGLGCALFSRSAQRPLLRTPEGPPTKREVSSRGTAAREDTVVLSNKAS